MTNFTVRLAFAVVVALLGMFALAPAPVRASSNPSYDAAYASCMAWNDQTQKEHYTGAEPFDHCGPRGDIVINRVYFFVHCNTGDTKCISVHGTAPYFTPAYWSFSGSIPPPEDPPPTCTAGKEHPGLWTPPGGGTVSVNGCCATPYIGISPDGSTDTGVAETGALCEATDTPPPITSDPPPQAITCHDDGTCTYCDVENTGICVDGPPPFSVSSGGGNPAPASSSPPPPPSSGGGDPAPSSSSPPPSGDPGGGTGGGGTGTGSGGGGTMDGTGNPTPQPGGNGDWAKANPDNTTSKDCTAGDACNAGQASGQIGRLYQPSTATIGSLYGDFRAQVSQAPLLQAGKNFFTVNASGTCPTWHIPGNKYWGEAGFDFSFFCDPAILAILAAAGWIVLAVGAFNAFRIAIY